MGDGHTPLTRAEARHLLRRTGFGALPTEVTRITGVPRGVAADDLLNFKPSRFRLRGDDIPALHASWVQYLVRPRIIQRGTKTPSVLRRSRHALQEKLVIFWHDHFATDTSNVGRPDAIMRQNQLFRRMCKGNFKAFVKAINKDPMMMAFLDTIRNLKIEPNENYARELQELFTLGVADFAGNPTYRQEDIVQIARAFTGWRFTLMTLKTFFDGSPVCDAGLHDYTACYPERGPKVIYRDIGGFGPDGRSFAADGEGPQEIDTVIDIIFEHRDTDNQNTVARHIARKLFTYFAHPNPDPAVIDALVAESHFDTTFEIQPLLRALFVHDAFYASAAPPEAAVPKSVKWPIDYVVSTMRTLRMEFSGDFQYFPSLQGSARTSLTAMGQRLLQPPSVFGWDWEEAWVTSGRLLARFAFANEVISARVTGRGGFHPERLIDGSLNDPGDIVDAVTDLFGIADQLTSAERQALIDYLGGPLDLADAHARNTKLHGLVGLVLVSPAYQLQ